ncbi:MAG: peptidoglycan-binding protein [Ilumatobacteraceae bacterium]|nr:peptidoglycan-binding protein [Ilumatobacteraceae bacterium]
MRTLRSHLLVLAAGPLLVVGLAACVQPAEKSTSSDTIAPLVLPTASYVTVPPTSTIAPPIAVDTTPTVLITAGTVAPGTPATSGLGADVGSTITIAPTGTTVPVGTDSSPKYTVVANDTMFGIARRCSITATALAAFNSWSDGDKHVIYPGLVIKLPCTPKPTTTSTTTTIAGSSGATTTTAAGTTDSATSTTFDASTGGTYTVVAGDYLAGIAAKIGTTVQAIVAANGWPNDKHVIIPGQKIKVPPKQ